MEPRSPQFQKELGCIEELINALNGAADSVVSAKSRELVQALLELHGTTLERLFEIVHEKTLRQSIDSLRIHLFPICWFCMVCIRSIWRRAYLMRLNR